MTPMKYRPYSYSKIMAWEQCPKKFEFQYIKKIPRTKVPVYNFDKGTFIHLLFEHNGDIEKIKKTNDYKEIVDNGLLTKEDIKKFYGVYTKFKNSKIGKNILSKRELVKELPIGVTESGNFVSYDSKEALLRGFIDAAYLDEKTNTLIIVDWKTGKIPWKLSFKQLLYYGIALFSKMPYDNIIIIYAYVEHMETKTQVLKRKNLDKYLKALTDIVKDIENDIEFPKNESALCDYCDFRTLCDKELTDDEIPF